MSEVQTRTSSGGGVRPGQGDRTRTALADFLAGKRYSLALPVLGAVLLLDSLGAITANFGNIAPIVCAAVGAILVATGLTRRD